MSRFIISLFCVALGFWGGVQFDAPAQTPPLASPLDYYLSTEFRYIKAVDGDTLDVAGPDMTGPDVAGHGGHITRIRLHGIDTPERGRPMFKAATSKLQALCKTGPIRLTHIGDGRYGRISANVYCSGVHVNSALIQHGFAIIAIPYANDTQLYEVQNTARAQCKGVWRKDLRQNYPPARLKGRSPIKGLVKFSTNPSCLEKAR